MLLENRDGRFSSQLRQTESKTKEEGYFEPATLEDERERKLREIVQRRGQPEFRAKLIEAYGGHCAVTGSDAEQALEAAHLTPYLGLQSNHVSNGLLLRADIHTLFDLDLIGIDPTSLTIAVAEQLQQTCYAKLKGVELTLPDGPVRPSREALRWRWDRFMGK